MTRGPGSIRIVVLPGDGIGPAVVAAALQVLEAVEAPFRWEVHDVGRTAFDAGGEALPSTVVDAVARCGLALKGPVATPLDGAFPSVNTALRRALDLHAQARPVRSLPGVPGAVAGVDVVVVREATEDLYRGVEVMPGTSDAAELLAWLAARGHDLPASTGLSLKTLSSGAARRALRFAFEYAVDHGRRRVTVVHKASVMRATDAVFLGQGRALASDYPGLLVDDLAVDAAAAALVRRPQDLDVLVTTNQYGDVLSDVAAAVTGGLGLAAGGAFGDGVAVFEATHGTAPRLAGTDRANPFALVLCGALLLEHVGLTEKAERVRAAVAAVLDEGEAVTYDLRAPEDKRPPVGTRCATHAVVRHLGSRAPGYHPAQGLPLVGRKGVT